MPNSARRRNKTVARRALSRADWIEAARTELIAKGVGFVKVGRLARNLKVTRGSFYWHFKHHEELLDELLRLWEDRNTRPFEEVLESDGLDLGYREFLSIVNLYVEENSYNPSFDTAVRDWARISRVAAAAVKRVDARRINILHRVFVDLGCGEPEALVRARVTYFHQVGYYAMNMKEDLRARLALVPTYVAVLTGKTPDAMNGSLTKLKRALDLRAVPGSASAD